MSLVINKHISMGVQYVDNFQIDEASKIQDGPGGSIIVDSYVTRVGVFKYGDDDFQLRHPDDIFKDESISTLNNCTLTLLHPKEEAVTPENYRQVVIGNILNGSVAVDGDYVRAKVLIHDAEAIELVKSKTIKELSCGYEADRVEEVGTWNDAAYNSRQVNIFYNHVSLVPQGRAGPRCSLFLDHATNEQSINRNSTMTDTNVEAPEDKDKDEVKDAKALIKQGIKDKMRIINTAAKIKKDFDSEAALDLEDQEIVKAVVSEVAPSLDLEGKSDEYLLGAFEALAIEAPEEVQAAAEEVAPEALAEAPVDAKEEDKKDTKNDTKDGKSDLASIRSRLFKKIDAVQTAEVKHVDSNFDVLKKFEASMQNAWKTKTA